MIEIDYFLTLNSPWAYLGSARFAQIAKRHRARVTVRPMNIGQVFAETGGLPLPRRSPERQAYRLVELARWRDFLGVPIVLQPNVFPCREEDANRLVLAAALKGENALTLAGEIGRTLWERNEDFGDKTVLDAAAARVGIDADWLRAGLSEQYAQTMLETNTAEARKAGVFGAPAYVVRGELFWGQDRLDFLDRKLAQLTAS